MLAISVAPEYLFTIGPYPITNTLFTSMLATGILTVIALVIYCFRLKIVWLDILTRMFISFMLSLVDMVTEDQALSLRMFPLIATFFLSIVTANLLALFPGFLGSAYMLVGGQHVPILRSPNSDLNTTVALAVISVISTQVLTVRSVGIIAYIGRFINFTGPLQFVLGIFEFVSEGMKLISFSFRLFGNIFAGEVLLLVAAFFLPIVLPVPFLFLELFVGIIQAFIFAMLTLAFIKTSTMRHAVSV